MVQIYLNLNGEQVGPIESKAWVASCQAVKLDDQAWYDGCSDWILIQDLPGTQKLGGAWSSV